MTTGVRKGASSTQVKAKINAVRRQGTFGSSSWADWHNDDGPSCGSPSWLPGQSIHQNGASSEDGQVKESAITEQSRRRPASVMALSRRLRDGRGSNAVPVITVDPDAELTFEGENGDNTNEVQSPTFNQSGRTGGSSRWVGTPVRKVRLPTGTGASPSKWSRSPTKSMDMSLTDVGNLSDDGGDLRAEATPVFKRNNSFMSDGSVDSQTMPDTVDHREVWREDVHFDPSLAHASTTRGDIDHLSFSEVIPWQPPVRFGLWVTSVPKVDVGLSEMKESETEGNEFKPPPDPAALLNELGFDTGEEDDAGVPSLHQELNFPLDDNAMLRENDFRQCESAVGQIQQVVFGDCINYLKFGSKPPPWLLSCMSAAEQLRASFKRKSSSISGAGGRGSAAQRTAVTCPRLTTAGIVTNHGASKQLSIVQKEDILQAQKTGASAVIHQLLQILSGGCIDIQLLIKVGQSGGQATTSVSQMEGGIDDDDGLSNILKRREKIQSKMAAENDIVGKLLAEIRITDDDSEDQTDVLPTVVIDERSGGVIDPTLPQIEREITGSRPPTGGSGASTPALTRLRFHRIQEEVGSQVFQTLLEFDEKVLKEEELENVQCSPAKLPVIKEQPNDFLAIESDEDEADADIDYFEKSIRVPGQSQAAEVDPMRNFKNATQTRMAQVVTDTAPHVAGANRKYSRASQSCRTMLSLVAAKSLMTAQRVKQSLNLTTLQPFASVFLRPATYDGPMNIDVPGVTISACMDWTDGRTSTVRIVGSASSPAGIMVSAPYVSLRQLSVLSHRNEGQDFLKPLDASQAANACGVLIKHTAHHTLLDSCEVSCPGGRGISIIGSQNVTITDSVVAQCYACGIRVSQQGNARIESTTVAHVAFTGIACLDEESSLVASGVNVVDAKDAFVVGQGGTLSLSDAVFDRMDRCCIIASGIESPADSVSMNTKQNSELVAPTMTKVNLRHIVAMRIGGDVLRASGACKIQVLGMRAVNVAEEVAVVRGRAMSLQIKDAYVAECTNGFVIKEGAFAIIKTATILSAEGTAVYLHGENTRAEFRGFRFKKLSGFGIQAVNGSNAILSKGAIEKCDKFATDSRHRSAVVLQDVQITSCVEGVFSCTAEDPKVARRRTIQTGRSVLAHPVHDLAGESDEPSHSDEKAKKTGFLSKLKKTLGSLFRRKHDPSQNENIAKIDEEKMSYSSTIKATGCKIAQYGKVFATVKDTSSVEVSSCQIYHVKQRQGFPLKPSDMATSKAELPIQCDGGGILRMRLLNDPDPADESLNDQHTQITEEALNGSADGTAAASFHHQSKSHAIETPESESLKIPSPSFRPLDSAESDTQLCRPDHTPCLDELAHGDRDSLNRGHEVVSNIDEENSQVSLGDAECIHENSLDEASSQAEAKALNNATQNLNISAQPEENSLAENVGIVKQTDVRNGE